MSLSKKDLAKLIVENTDVKNDKNDMNRLSIRQTVVKNRNIMGNANDC